MNRKAHPPGWRLFFGGRVRRIIGGFNLREPLHADGVDVGDPVFEGYSFDIILHLAIAENPLQGNELPLLDGPGELGEVPPGIDAVPIGAVLVISLVVLPAFLGGNVEDDILVLVLGGFGFCVLSEAADEGDFVEHVIWLHFFVVCPLSAVHACPESVPSRPTPSASGENLRKGTQTCYGDRSPHLAEARSGILLPATSQRSRDNLTPYSLGNGEPEVGQSPQYQVLLTAKRSPENSRSRTADFARAWLRLVRSVAASFSDDRREYWHVGQLAPSCIKACY